ncbi:MAG: ATP-binding protein [Bryobacteraceae bacterium]|nr:ATP-binding protein [Bryobacteraceae bacterium]
MRRYEPASTILTSNRPVEEWGKLLCDVAAVSAMLDRLLHHGHILKSNVARAATALKPRRRPEPPAMQKERIADRCEGGALALPGFTAFGPG